MGKIVRRYQLSKALAPAAALLALMYFAYHTVNGNHGLHAWAELRDREAMLQPVADGLALDRARLERRVASLRPGNIDPDLLDEKVRQSLGFSDEKDIVIFLEK